MTDQFLGEIRIVPFNFAPIDWAMCQGQLLPISRYAALFSLLGTQFGGDGRSTFALPNFQGNIPVNQGSGPGLTPRDMGETGGSTNVTLLYSEMPAHGHFLQGDSDPADKTGPGGNLPAVLPGGRESDKGYDKSPATTQMFPNGAQLTGGNQPHDNMMPYLSLNFIISLVGVFPARG
jgi:microcystin-dependent protein